MNVVLVPLEDINKVWPIVAPMLQKAVDRQRKRGIDDVYVDLIDYGHNLWIALDDEDQIVGVVTSEIIEYPKQRCLFLGYLGGKPGNGWEWREPMLDILQRWAYDNQCDTIEFVGRKGWDWVFRDYGGRVTASIFELPVGNKGILEV